MKTDSRGQCPVFPVGMGRCEYEFNAFDEDFEPLPQPVRAEIVLPTSEFMPDDYFAMVLSLPIRTVELSGVCPRESAFLYRFAGLQRYWLVVGSFIRRHFELLSRVRGKPSAEFWDAFGETVESDHDYLLESFRLSVVANAQFLVESHLAAICREIAAQYQISFPPKKIMTRFMVVLISLILPGIVCSHQYAGVRSPCRHRWIGIFRQSRRYETISFTRLIRK